MCSTLYFIVKIQLKLNFFLHRFPFDTTKPIGYFISTVFEYIIIVNELFAMMCMSIFIIGACLMIISFADDIKCDLQSLNRTAKVNDDYNRLEIILRFSQFIQFHTNAKELSKFLNYFLDN